MNTHLPSSFGGHSPLLHFGSTFGGHSSLLQAPDAQPTAHSPQPPAPGSRLTAPGSRPPAPGPRPMGIALLGCTGSIGRQTLDVLRTLGPNYRVV
ncbi:MAG: hypothetical protein M3Z04_09230, partial [Chloroflexota bacterium]|nr:hypothetical protein [Chloroflexota bacterium]